VDELADPGIAEEAYRAHQELAVTAHGVQDLRHHVQHLLGGCPVRGEVVLTAQPVVIYPGRVRDVRADVRRNPVPRLARSGHSTLLAITCSPSIMPCAGRAEHDGGNKAAARNQPADAALTLAWMRVQFTRHPRPLAERADRPRKITRQLRQTTRAEPATRTAS